MQVVQLYLENQSPTLALRFCITPQFLSLSDETRVWYTTNERLTKARSDDRTAQSQESRIMNHPRLGSTSGMLARPLDVMTECRKFKFGKLCEVSKKILTLTGKRVDNNRCCIETADYIWSTPPKSKFKITLIQYGTCERKEHV